MWRESPLFADLREPQTGGACRSCGSFDSCRGGCMAAKFFTGLPLDGPDPECVQGHSASALARERDTPRPRADHSHGRRGRQPVPLALTVRPPAQMPAKPPARLCNESPL